MCIEYFGKQIVKDEGIDSENTHEPQYVLLRERLDLSVKHCLEHMEIMDQALYLTTLSVFGEDRLKHSSISVQTRRLTDRSLSHMAEESRILYSVPYTIFIYVILSLLFQSNKSFSNSIQTNKGLNLVKNGQIFITLLLNCNV